MAEGVVDRSSLPQPHQVAEAYYAYLTSPSPRRRWMVVPARREAEATLASLFRRIAETNVGDHAYSREDLVRMLDAALADTDGGGR